MNSPEVVMFAGIEENIPVLQVVEGWRLKGSLNTDTGALKAVG